MYTWLIMSTLMRIDSYFISLPSGHLELCAGKCSVLAEFLSPVWTMQTYLTTSAEDTGSDNQHCAQMKCNSLFHD